MSKVIVLDQILLGIRDFRLVLTASEQRSWQK